MELLSFILSFLIYLLVAAPFCLVLHELGHALMILVLTRQKAVFQFGKRGAARDFALGRITARFFPDPHALFFCRYRLDNKSELTRTQDVWITLGGPLSSLLFTCLFGAVWLSARGDPWSGLTLINLFNFLIAGVPGYYPSLFAGQVGIANDGLQLVQLLKGQSG